MNLNYLDSKWRVREDPSILSQLKERLLIREIAKSNWNLPSHKRTVRLKLKTNNNDNLRCGARVRVAKVRADTAERVKM